MRVVPCTIVIACLLAGLSGCQLFNRKNNDADTPFLGSRSNDQPKAVAPADPLIGGAGGAADLEGLLAGRVIDGTGRPADAQIRWVCLEESKEDGAPLEVAVNAQGYFMIQGLKSGKNYKLITRAKSGENTLEVVTLTKAPNVHLVIQVNEKFAVPPGSEKGKGNSDKKKSASTGKEQPASAQIPIPTPGWPQPEPTMLPPAGSLSDKSRIAQDKFDVGIKLPIVKTPGPNSGGHGWQLPSDESAAQPVPVVPSPFDITIGPPPVPSSVYVGTRLVDFTLNDLQLRPWQLKTKRRGSVVLLDFWKTNCVPCLQSIHNLRNLQDKYGPQGLEIIGIAYEDTPALAQQAQQVAATASYRKSNYQLLLGGGANCPLKRDLEVRAYPTFVLLDATGVIVWRHEGGFDPATLEELEFRISRALSRDQY